VAINVGFRHIDAAYFFQNEEESGMAFREKIADGTVKREDLFCATKVNVLCVECLEAIVN
jgi:diketogulonate reductase-like aldo/keto reductase